MKTTRNQKRAQIELGLLDFRLRTKAQEHGIKRIEFGVFIVNAPGILLLQKRNEYGLKGGQGLLSGTLKARETLVQAAKREAYEQLGLVLERVVNITLGFDVRNSIGQDIRYFLICARADRPLCKSRVRINPLEHSGFSFLTEAEEIGPLSASREVQLLLRRILSNKQVVTTFIGEGN